MKPVDQTIFGDGKGNCFAACVASILEIPLAEVPNFCADHPPDEWWAEFRTWLGRRGMDAISLICDPEDRDDILPHCPVMALGPGPRGSYHYVVYLRGKMIHDPHPSRAGLLKREMVEILVPLHPERSAWTA